MKQESFRGPEEAPAEKKLGKERNETPEEFELEEQALRIMFEGLGDPDPIKRFTKEIYENIPGMKRVRVRDAKGAVIYDQPQDSFERDEMEFAPPGNGRGRIDTAATD